MNHYHAIHNLLTDSTANPCSDHFPSSILAAPAHSAHSQARLSRGLASNPVRKVAVRRQHSSPRTGAVTISHQGLSRRQNLLWLRRAEDRR